MLSLLFPCHPLDPRQVDPDHAQERDAFRAAGHPIHLIDTDALERGERTKVVPALPELPEPLLYRGWMLSEAAYTRLAERVEGRLITSPVAYLASHHLPGWYPALADLTIPSEWGPPDQAQAHWAAWNAAGRTRAFVKDYVKSVKTGQGSGVASAADLDRVMADMVTYKGFIEGGVVMREWVDLDEASEVRAFVWQGRVHWPHAAVAPALVALIRSEGQVRTQTVQRHLQLGYNRAANLIQAMEGTVVSAPNERGLRSVLPLPTEEPTAPRSRRSP